MHESSLFFFVNYYCLVMFQQWLTSLFCYPFQLSLVLFLLFYSEQYVHAAFRVMNATVRSGEASWIFTDCVPSSRGSMKVKRSVPNNATTSSHFSFQLIHDICAVTKSWRFVKSHYIVHTAISHRPQYCLLKTVCEQLFMQMKISQFVARREKISFSLS